MTEWPIVVSVVMKICCIILGGSRMNIVEAFNKLEKNRNLKIIYGNITYEKKSFNGNDILYVTQFKSRTEERFVPLYRSFTYFTLEEVLSNDWEVME